MPDLKGQRAIVTRAKHQAEQLATLLRGVGADVIFVPVIGIAPPIDDAALRRSAERIDDYDWLVFTSANAVEAFAERLGTSALAARTKVAAIGAATAERARSLEFPVSLTPEESVSEALAAAIGASELRGRKILIPSAAVTRNVLAAELSSRGAFVDVVEAYRNVMPPEAAAAADAAFQEPLPDWITFASPSAVNNLVKLVDRKKIARCRIASIGPVTSEALHKFELSPAIEANPHTVSAMVAAMTSSNQIL